MLSKTKTMIAVGLAGLILNVQAHAEQKDQWKIGTPIATYFAGPLLTDAAAKQMKEGGFNVVWCTERELGVAKANGLRVMLHDELLVPESLNDPSKLAKLDELIKRVKKHTAIYAYYITDEPSAAAFPGLGKLVAYIREKDPNHFAYINLFPTYANNEQLAVSGDVTTAYKEYLRQFIEKVKPSLLSYDHYHFTANGDTQQYFLNLGLIRQAALDANIPFLNIVQACTWDKGMRAPNANEMRWLNSTSLAYGAQGLSYFVYFHDQFYREFLDKAGQMMLPDGTTTPLYDAAKVQLPEFVNVASQLQPLRSLGAYHTGPVPLGALALPNTASFCMDLAQANKQGMLIGYFGKSDKPTHVFVVNLDYVNSFTTKVYGPGNLEVFDATTKTWKKADGESVSITFPPGGGKLIRLQR